MTMVARLHLPLSRRAWGRRRACKVYSIHCMYWVQCECTDIHCHYTRVNAGSGALSRPV